SICEAANSASLASLISARFSDIILSKAGRGVAATPLRPLRARLELVRRLLTRALFFAALFFRAPRLARLCADTPSSGKTSGQTMPKQIMKANRRIHGRFFFIIPQTGQYRGR